MTGKGWRTILDAAERVAVRVARGRGHFEADEDAELAIVRAGDHR
jgi:hypothetical protein